MGKRSVGLRAEKESTIELVGFDRVCSVTLVTLTTRISVAVIHHSQHRS